LETEAYVLPIDLYLDSRLAAFQDRLTNSEIEQLIEKACQTIQNRIRNRREHKRAQEASIEEQRQK
jgi:spore cortex formation protein SpoVR/YcgB (stage V sporulation)